MKKIPHGSVAIIAFSSVLVVDKNIFSHFYFLTDLFSYTVLCLVTMLGAFAPDVDYKFVRREVIIVGNQKMWQYDYNSALANHRQITHSLLLWVVFFSLALYFKNTLLIFFTVGGLSHLVADYFTGDIPLLLYGYREDKDEIKLRRDSVQLLNDIKKGNAEVIKNGWENEIELIDESIVTLSDRRYRIGVN